MVFNSLNVHLHLVYNVAPRNHIEGKCKKFKTSRINKSPSHFSFDTGTVPAWALARGASKKAKLLAQGENLLVPDDRKGVISSPVKVFYI